MDDLKQMIGLRAARRLADRGARFCDRYEHGWADRIDATRLNMANHKDCIGGQLSGHYDDFRSKHSLTIPQSVRLGFGAWASLECALVAMVCPHDDDECFNTAQRDEFGYSYGDLTAAWREEIQQRRCATRGRIVISVDGTASVEGKALVTV